VEKGVKRRQVFRSSKAGGVKHRRIHGLTLAGVAVGDVRTAIFKRFLQGFGGEPIGCAA
jgi:hypothetical protein